MLSGLSADTHISSASSKSYSVKSGILSCKSDIDIDEVEEEESKLLEESDRSSERSSELPTGGGLSPE